MESLAVLHIGLPSHTQSKTGLLRRLLSPQCAPTRAHTQKHAPTPTPTLPVHPQPTVHYSPTEITFTALTALTTVSVTVSINRRLRSRDSTEMSDIAAPPATHKVDRATTTPFLLKLYYRQGAFHRLDDFRGASQPRDHIQIYTWRDCTLHELAVLLSDALPHVCPPRARCVLRLIFADTRFGNARYTSKELGAVVPIGSDDPFDAVARKTLAEVQFVVGDWIDVAVYPEGHGGVGADGLPSRVFSGGRGGVLGGPRENGFGGFKVRGGARGAGGGSGGSGAGGGVGGSGGPGGGPGGGGGGGEWRRGERIEDFDRLGAGRGGGGGPGGGSNGNGNGGGGGSGGGYRRGRRYRD